MGGFGIDRYINRVRVQEPSRNTPIQNSREYPPPPGVWVVHFLVSLRESSYQFIEKEQKHWKTLNQYKILVTSVSWEGFSFA